MTSPVRVTGVTADGWSAYDDAVPTTHGLADVVDRARDLRAMRPPAPGASLASVRDLVVVVSSSRGGSSLFGELLRRTTGLLHLRAEINPLYTLAGLHSGTERRAVLEAELLRDIGRPLGPGPLDDVERPRLAADLAWRLVVQWPEVAAQRTTDELLDVARRSLPEDDVAFDRSTTMRTAVDLLRREGLPVDLRYYDLPAERRDGRPSAPEGPPGPALVEMPPFVSVDRWRLATAEELETRPVMLSTPRLSYRLDHIRELFPSARMQVIHLTRNPAASVNGLIDGWRHHGFYNCEVPVELEIAGYSDRTAGGRSWWCYDVPPGWESWVRAPLPQVCAFQWRSSHRAAMEATSRLGLDVLRVPFEAVSGAPAERAAVLAELGGWLGLGGGVLGHRAPDELPVVMATEPPRPRRWAKRSPRLGPVLRAPEVREVAEDLGYEADPGRWR